MVGIDLVANRKNFAGTFAQAGLPNAHSRGADIVNLNGKLLCNPTVDSFTVTCKTIEVATDELSARCLKRNGTRVPATLKLAGYHGLISNCDGVLKKGSC